MASPTSGHEFGQASGDGKAQGSLACCSPWGCRVGYDWVTEQHIVNSICTMKEIESEVTQSCPTLRYSMNCSTPGFPVYHRLLEFTQTHAHWVVMPSNHLILCRPLLLPPSIIPSTRVFSNESALHMKWPKYWSFSFSIRPSNEYSGLISFRIDWFDLLAVQGALKSLLQYHHCSKVSISSFCNGFKYA